MSRALASVGAAVLAVTVLSSCRSAHEFAPSREVRFVEVAEFSRNVPDDVAPSAAVAVDSRGGQERSASEMVTVRAGPPQIELGSAQAIESAVLVEAKVGDVNGKPIYANEFLEPMAARLAAEAERRPRGQWVPWAMTEIERRLQDIVTDELLRAEALARLTPEQKQGLRYFLANARADLASGAAGSRSLAQKRLAEEQGMTEDEFIRSREQETLIRATIMREINNRVNVSWRDIEQRYQRDRKTFNPPPTAVFRLIRVPNSSAEGVAFVRDSLARGESFDVVADASESNYKPETGGIDRFEFEGEFADAAFFGSDVLNSVARTLSPGSHSDAFELGSSTAWLKLVEITTQSISLYDAQLVIQQQLFTERRSRELERFLSRLQQRASFTSLTDMRDQLFIIADRRYGSPSAGRTP
ncbi:MAG: hypothetical protein KF757_08215 [Phycisphaeraceae bacterium]|nr:hypothetical protein [Phycisphaeraceae bacterium]MCW5762740.1 hypothetical protein [Phycisphaeraceae bacterium]